MTGNNICKCGSFKSLYEMQLKNQQELLNKGKYENYTLSTLMFDKLPKDDISLFSYHIQQLQSEIGELLHSDRRWKNFRKHNIDTENKKEEIADCFIVLMNIAIFSGICSDELYNSINEKIRIVSERVRNCDCE